MSRTLPHDALHRALVARLRADDVAGDRVYGADSVPLNPAFPYVTVQVVDGVADYSVSTEAYEALAAVTARTRSVAGAGNAQEAYGLAQAALAALTRDPLDLSADGFAVIVDAGARGPASSPLQSYPSASGTHTHRDLTLTLRLRLQKTP